MNKTFVKQIRCSKKGCNANAILYPCPYCEGIFCEFHLKEHLNKYAFEGLKLEEGCCNVNTLIMHGVLEE